MQAASTPLRRHDLDWLRVGALGLLILTHVTYVYRTTGWRIHSENAGLWGDLIVAAMAPWRMTLVFFIGGVATRFMLQGHDLGSFVANRFLRLGLPFAMAVVFLVPVMWWVTDPESHAYSYVQYVWHTPLHAHTVFGFHLPDLGHVWFLSYLLAYALLAGLAWRFAPGLWRKTEALVDGQATWMIFVGLAMLFVLSDALMRPAFGRTDMFIDDPAGHVRCLPPFLLGVMVARSDAFWDKLRASRGWLLPLALALGVAALVMAGRDTLSGHQLPPWQSGTADGIFGAAAVLAILAGGQSALNRPSPQLAYFSDAIMPVYLMHQVVIVLAGVALLKAGFPGWVEYPALLAATALIPLAIYHVAIRRFDPLRLVFGLKTSPRAADASTRKITTP